MTVIKQDDLIDSIAGALQFISYYHPVDFIRAMDAAYQREQNPAARDAIAQILINSRMCAEGRRPICQDTGIVTIFLKVGMEVQWQAQMSVTDMCNEGIRRAYLDPDNVLRVEKLIADYTAAEGAAVLWVSHDPLQTARVGHRQIYLEAGKLGRAAMPRPMEERQP